MATTDASSSLKRILGAPAQGCLRPYFHTWLESWLIRIVTHFKSTEAPGVRYSGADLIRYTYEYSRTRLSRDIFLKVFFHHLNLTDFGIAWNFTIESLRDKFYGFAELLFDNLYLPFKLAGLEYPKRTQSEYIGPVQQVTMEKGESLESCMRKRCLQQHCNCRDSYRCMVTGLFDVEEARSRMALMGDAARDNEGRPLAGQRLCPLMTAHIIPRALSMPYGQLSESKKIALMILDMMDFGVSSLVSGTNIDTPSNALTLSAYHRCAFGVYVMYFEPLMPEKHTYLACSMPLVPTGPAARAVVRRLHPIGDWFITPPSPRLLAVHRAIAHVLQLSGANRYISSLFPSAYARYQGTKPDGSTQLGLLTTLQWQGWLGKGFR